VTVLQYLDSTAANIFVSSLGLLYCTEFAMYLVSSVRNQKREGRERGEKVGRMQGGVFFVY
jgi:hypothetical protein